jgi:hypothetical protein
MSIGIHGYILLSIGIPLMVVMFVLLAIPSVPIFSPSALVSIRIFVAFVNVLVWLVALVYFGFKRVRLPQTR